MRTPLALLALLATLATLALTLPATDALAEDPPPQQHNCGQVCSDGDAECRADCKGDQACIAQCDEDGKLCPRMCEIGVKYGSDPKRVELEMKKLFMQLERADQAKRDKAAQKFREEEPRPRRR